MKKLCIICFIFLFGCKSKQNCDEKICTEEFRSIKVVFKNTVNEPIDVEDFQVYNMRTKKNIMDHFLDSYHIKGNYTIITDGSLKEVSFEGDRLIVSAKNPVSKLTKETEFTVSGGECNCHVYKISGPTEIILP